ncbi:hypothetical protein [Limibacillus halophilus]
MKKSLLTATAAFALGAFAASGLNFDATSAFDSLIPGAKAQTQGSGQAQNRAGGSGLGQGGSAGQGQRSTIDATIFRGKGERVIIIFEDDGSDSSTRPEWAQGNRELNPNNRSGGGSNLPGARQDFFGDLLQVLRDENGEPILYNDEVQPYVCDGDVCGYTYYVIDPATGDPVLSDEVLVSGIDADGEKSEVVADLVPNAEMILEADIGRTNVARAPAPVMDHSLDEAVTKILTAETVSLEPGTGRILVDGVAIDSPLENLAIYEALMKYLDPYSYADEPTGDVLTALAAIDALGVNPESLLAAATDKTSPLSLDELIYLNTFLGINTFKDGEGDTVLDFYDLSSLGDYSRSTTYENLWVSYLGDCTDTGCTVITGTLIDVVFGGVDDWAVDAADVDFVLEGAAADYYWQTEDARAVIEWVHDTLGAEVLTVNPNP